MLNVVKKITFEGTSEFEGKVAQGYSANIDDADPTILQMNNWIVDYPTYKLHRDECRTDRTTFEDKVYAAQQELEGE